MFLLRHPRLLPWPPAYQYAMAGLRTAVFVLPEKGIRLRPCLLVLPPEELYELVSVFLVELEGEQCATQMAHDHPDPHPHECSPLCEELRDVEPPQYSPDGEKCEEDGQVKEAS